jgi:hypothetical protein
MEQPPILVDRQFTVRLGKSCDIITFRVREGREDAWANAAQMWALSYRADVRGAGLVEVVVPRLHAEIVTDTQAALQDIACQYSTNLNRSAQR